MICFAKDLGVPEGESKYDMLAVSVARTIGVETRFCHPDYPAKLAVSQFGDGMSRVAKGERNVYIFHDWFDAYFCHMSDTYDKAIFLGSFEHPELPRSVKLNSYPVDAARKLPMDNEYPVLVCGEYDGICLNWLLKRIGELRGNSVRVVCYSSLGCSDADYLDGFADAICGVEQCLGTGFKLGVDRHTPIDLLREYMASARYILHCGGHRGLIHSMAVSTKKCMSYTGDDNYSVTRISELNARLLTCIR